MTEDTAGKPLVRTESYLKYGFVIMECECFLCPECGEALNAGPNYQPQYCGRCGQKITFEGIEWKPEKMLGYLEKRDSGYEQVEN